MLLEMAVGDAYGAAFEFTKTPQIPNDLSRFGAHPLGEMEVGAYTDDTMRAIANSKVILSADKNDKYRPEAYAKAYLEEFRNDRRKGWSKRFHAMLEEHVDKNAMELIKKIARRNTNGCLMGVAPLGYLPQINDVLLATTMQVVSTHSGSSVPYAQGISIAAHLLMRGVSSNEIITAVIELVEWESNRQRDRFHAILKEEPPIPQMESSTITLSALWAIDLFDKSSDILKWSCSRGGDCDSLGAVTMALASVSKDIEQDIPDILQDNVDTMEGRKSLLAIDTMLKETFKTKCF